MPRKSFLRVSVFSVFFLFLIASASLAGAQGRSLIVLPVDDTERVSVRNSTHRLVSLAGDQGALDPGAKMERMLLVLGAGEQQEKALREMLESQQDKTSPTYHQWLTPEQFGQQFGPTPEDLRKVTAWLQSQGFTVGSIARSRRWVEFNGTAGAVGAAFHTEMRRYQAAGAQHVANASDISIPLALAPAVRGVLSLHNFFSKPMLAAAYQVRRDPAGLWEPVTPAATFTGSNGVFHVLAPGDYERIYNLAPLRQSGLDGSGQTIAIVARSSVRPTDALEFRRIFNLPANDPHIIFNGPEAGFLNFGDELEADLDLEWSGAVAPMATIDVVISASTLTTDGVDLSSAYIVDNNLAPVMSVSFGQCEQNMGLVENAFYNSLWQQAAAQGISVIVSSGDNGAAGCDIPTNSAASGPPAVNGLASTPFNTAVGGTQFQENGNDAVFWNATNTTGSVSARGYIPEAVWNESCSPTAPNSKCPAQGNLFAGSGGVSTLYAKPNWQAAAGVPNDGKRDLPDVSLAAAGGHDGYLVCFIATCQTRDDANGQPVLVGATIVGGTSASAPSFAGIMALVNQKTGARQGQAGYILYRMAASQDPAGCNSSSIADPTAPSPCAFYDVTAGNNTVPGLTGFSALAGFDLATGLGSVNAANLVNGWNSATFQGSTTGLSASTTSVQHGQPVPITVIVQARTGTGTPSGTFALLSDKFGPAGIGPLTGGSFSGAFATLPGGQYNLTAHYQGDGVFGASDSSPVALNITPENSSISLTSWQFGAFIPFQTASIGYGDFLFFQAAVKAASGNGVPAGTVTFQEGTTVLGTITLSGKGEGNFSNNCFGPFFGVDPVVCLTPGSHVITATYSGDNSFNSVTSLPLTITVGKSEPTVLLQPSQTNLVSTQQVSFLALVGNNGPILPTGIVQFFDSGVAFGAPITIAPVAAGSRPQAVLRTALSVGTHVFTAVYSGDSVYTSNLSNFPGPATITVVAAGGVATQTLATPSAGTVGLGSSMSYSVVVSSSQTTPPVGGTVELVGDFGPIIAPVPVVNGAAAIPFQWSFGGQQTVVAQYSGDANYSPSSSAPVAVTVTPVTPVLALSSSSAALQSGQQVTLKVTFTPPVSLSVSSGELVQLFDSFNGSLPQAIGPARFTQFGDRFVNELFLPVTLPDGSHLITAQFQGNGTFNSATSNTITITVAPPAFHLAASSSSLAIVAGQSGSVTLTITPSAGFNATATLSCGAGVPAGATCSILPSSLALNGAPATAVLTITTVAPAAPASLTAKAGWNLLWPLGVAGIAGLALKSQRRRAKAVSRCLSLFFMSVLAMNISCGGGGGGSPVATPPPPPPGAVPSTTALTTSAIKAVNGSPLTLTATVAASAAPISGNVTFFDGSAHIGSQAVNNGQARLQLISLGLGTHSLSARYNGNSNIQPSTSGVLKQAITGNQQLQVTVSAAGQAATSALSLTIQ